ncbi:MAG: hypothetical protein FWC80_06140 [Firmicutes bacterium]|nr:hypothetical protein [Bacillota bacterium]
MNSQKTFKKNKLFIVLICMLLMAVASVVVVFGSASVSAYAATPTPISTDLFSGRTRSNGANLTTNSFNVTHAPAITVLTHGLGGSAAHWSNNGTSSFAFDNRSLIERLRRESGGNVFWARMHSSTNFRLHKVPTQSQLTTYSISLPTVSQLSFYEISQHMIIVFEATDRFNGNARNGTHQDKYNEFRTMLHTIVRDFAYLTGGVYPRVNLIGHSRGGLSWRNLGCYWGHYFDFECDRRSCTAFSMLQS